MNNLFARWWSLRTVYILFLGQLVSFVLALKTFASSLIASLGVDAPLTQSLFIYLSLGLVYGSVLIYKRQCLRVCWYWYLLLGFVDVQGKYFFNKAFQYSSITSVTLLGCFGIAWVIVLTWIFLGTRYSLCQLFGALLCVAGLGLVFLSNAGVRGGGGLNPLLGDALVILATIFFALSNVGEEFCVKKKDRVEVVCMIGVFGFLVTVPFVELKSLKSVTWTADIALAFVGYAFAGFMFYMVTPYVLEMSGATMYCLSILTADMWAVVFRVFIYHQQVDWLYYISFAVVVIGLVIYSVTEKDTIDEQSSLENGNSHQRYHLLPDENDASDNNGTPVL